MSRQGKDFKELAQVIWGLGSPKSAGQASKLETSKELILQLESEGNLSPSSSGDISTLMS